MHFKEWLSLFGRDSEDASVKAALAKRGVTKVPPIKKDRLDTRVEFDDSMLIFTTATLFPGRNAGGDGSSLLTGLVLPLKLKWGEYKGELPFQLNRTDSQKTLRDRFGEPAESDEDLNWDEWKIDGLLLHITYNEDYDALTSVTVQLPTEV
jgi:hypothetical protein